MKDGQRAFLQYVEALFEGGAVAEQTDRQLLQVFTAGGRMAAELAFTVLVKRHGPMVYQACQAILSDPHAAEDAFQATFLVLARARRGDCGSAARWGSWLPSAASRRPESVPSRGRVPTARPRADGRRDGDADHL